ncbi:MAG: FAD-dependent oxidoreductase [Actinomycetales bacterium]|nr:FAD-dependent oxidoreductase [Actinomycetales bacterium]
MTGTFSQQAHVRVAIIGGGPSGLRAAAELAGLVDGEVLVIERESAAGGIPRHCAHTGFGIRDLGRSMSGPAYARRLTERAVRAGARVMTSSMVTGWAGERALEVTSPAGRMIVQADVVILATGARERPQPARLIPGARSAGVLTSGELQGLVHLDGRRFGGRAVVVGSELVSWSAVLTLREAGCRTVAMATQAEQREAYGLVGALGRLALRVPVLTSTRVTRVLGQQAVTGVEVEAIDSGERRIIDCEIVVFSADWIPDSELARAAGLRMDAMSKAPVVDTALRTSRPGVFAIGNLLHPVDTADIAALDGAAVVSHVMAFLGGSSMSSDSIDLIAQEPFRWIAPARLRMDARTPPRGRLLAWSDERRYLPTIVATQAGRVIGSVRSPWPCVPGRVFRIPVRVLSGADPAGGPITIGLR